MKRKKMMVMVMVIVRKEMKEADDWAKVEVILIRRCTVNCLWVLL
jgi:hypothetical protein